MGMRILLIDDEEWNITKLTDLLGSKHISYDYASALEDALSLAKENKYDGVIVDFNMDRLNGSQLLQLFKGDFEGNIVGENITDLNNIINYDSEIGEVIEETFGDFSEYSYFVERFRETRFALFSSHSEFGGAYIPDGTYIGQKNNDDSYDYAVEIGIVDYLESSCVLKKN
jgi:PleD family two-component response regulator